MHHQKNAAKSNQYAKAIAWHMHCIHKLLASLNTPNHCLIIQKIEKVKKESRPFFLAKEKKINSASSIITNSSSIAKQNQQQKLRYSPYIRALHPRLSLK